MFPLHTSKSELETEESCPNHKRQLFRLGRKLGSHDNPARRNYILELRPIAPASGGISIYLGSDISILHT